MQLPSLKADNQAANTLRDALRSLPSLAAVIPAPEVLSKHAPYFGYVEIEVTGVEPFLMFSNNDDFVAQKYFWRGKDAYETHSVLVWAALASSSAVVVDIGSYSGLYSLVAATRNRRAKVYAFEALDRVFARFKINQAVNRLGNITAHHRAISDECGTVALNVYSGDSVLVTGSSIVEKAVDRSIHEKVSVPATTIDALAADGTIARVSLMKIDAEGAEHRVLKGAAGQIALHKPDILCEFLRGSETEQVEALLKPLGYRFFRINDAKGEISEISHLEPATGMNDLNSLLTTKSLEQVKEAVATVCAPQ